MGGVGIQETEGAKRRKAIRALARDLLRRVDSIDLDVIDGEFYWRYCQEEFAANAQRLRAKYKSGETSPIELDGIFRRVGATYSVPWRFLADHILLDAPIPMRTPAVDLLREQSADGEGSPTGVRLKIRSWSWTGAKLEGFLRARLAELQPIWPLEITDPSTGTPDLEVSARFVGSADDAPADPARAIAAAAREEPDIARLLEPDLRRDLSESVESRSDASDHSFVPDAAIWATTDGVIQPPYVYVDVRFPLPSATLLASILDAVRDDPAFRKRLPLPGERFDHEVAIRTWGTALLMRTGLSFFGALDLIADDLGFEIANEPQNTDLQCRRQLTKRTPEADPFVWKRRRKSPRRLSSPTG